MSTTRHSARALLIATIMTGVLVTGCASTAKTGPSEPSGYSITGTVYTSPACPGPVRLDSPCPDRPLPAVAVEATRDSQVVATTLTDADGHYRFTLPAGDYEITATNSGGLHRQASKTIDVPPAATVDLTIDSGMR